MVYIDRGLLHSSSLRASSTPVALMDNFHYCLHHFRRVRSLKNISPYRGACSSSLHGLPDHLQNITVCFHPWASRNYHWSWTPLHNFLKRIYVSRVVCFDYVRSQFRTDPRRKFYSLDVILGLDFSSTRDIIATRGIPHFMHSCETKPKVLSISDSLSAPTLM